MLKVQKQEYRYEGLVVVPVEGTVRRVPGGKCVDIRIEDERSTITYATVNVDLVRDRQGILLWADPDGTVRAETCGDIPSGWEDEQVRAYAAREGLTI
jgi:cytochrome c-type biogenesis protein CcmE